MRGRRITVHDCGLEAAWQAFSRDHVAISDVARGGAEAIVHVRRAPAEAVSLGRFHRRPGGDGPLFRRLSGGRVVAIGPGIVSLTGLFPSVAWLASGREAPGPDQVLNRALRPLLATLRAFGIDAFYGGRDLVTWDRAPVAVASFTVLPDGVVVVETHVAVSTPLDRAAALLAEWDPRGVVLHDASVFAGAPPIHARRSAAGEFDWTAGIAEHAGPSFGCDVSLVRTLEPAPPQRASAVAFAAFQAERGMIPAGWVSATALEMLGAVEAAGFVEGGRIVTLELSGDLIATHASVTEIEEACIGQPPTRAATERALLSVLTRPGRFLLGVRDLPGLIARLA